jgi:hypothetical protein
VAGPCYRDLIVVWLCLVALLVSRSEVVNGAPLPRRSSPEDVRVPGGKGGERPYLVFASDQPTDELESMLSERDVVANLIDLKAGIALSLPDLAVDRASLVRQLNRDDIPVTAWTNLVSRRHLY